ncbi:MAG: hypothetical protein RI947_81 [Candidatus Parcubacteria bacterium]|jgi:hypothetical protein
MNLRTEQNNEKLKILIIDKHGSEFSTVLKTRLEEYDNEVYVSPRLPQNIAMFEICFLINESHRTLDLITHFHGKRFVFIFLSARGKAEEFSLIIHKSGKKTIKVIHIDNPPETIPQEDLEKMLWFSFTQSNETILNFHYHKLKKPMPLPLPDTPHPRKRHLFSIKRFLIGIPLVLLIIHILYIPPLALGTYYVYLQAQALKQQNLEEVLKYNQKSQSILNTSKQLYTFAKPVMLVFSLAFFSDNIFQINESANSIFSEAVPLMKTGQAYLSLFMKKHKTDDEQDLLLQQQKILYNSIGDLHQDLSFLYQKLPEWHPYLKKAKQQIKTSVAILDGARKLIPQLDTIFAKNGEKKYLLMFANNMELRPGGGFIGSFAVVTVKDYGLDEMQVYDVYDADGQLKAHIEPPDPIRKYLHQPHWFLRDSAFSPDYPENYEQAKFFLSREMNLPSFDGGILLTTTAIQSVLEAMGDLYVPDYNEMVNRDNFYLKAQLYAEKDFFPGSTQKKHFLSSVMDQMLIQLEDASFPKLVQMIDKSLNEKQLVLFFEDQSLQKIIDAQYWSGRMITPACTSDKQNCISDYLMPVDANLGVNKANFFINRNVTLNVSIDHNGRIRNKYVIELRNDSQNYAFPGGVYKNYMQIALPREAEVKEITKNGTLIEGYDELNDTHKTIGFYVEVQPQSSIEIVMNYELGSIVQNGRGIYQLIFQKQIGSSNYDFNFALSFPKNIYVVNQNFSPLVKDNSIHYNTTIKADKIFYIELLKE